MSKRRKNPAHGLTEEIRATLTVSAADLLIDEALKDCSTEEKMLIAGLLPSLVRGLRRVELIANAKDSANQERPESADTKPEGHADKAKGKSN